MRGHISSGRTGLFRVLRRILRAALNETEPAAGIPHGRAPRFESRRRDFLARAAAATAWLGAGAPLLNACGRGSPRVAIVGAGIAGLTAANVLRKARVVADVYEAADRIGGRIHTIADEIIPGGLSELGGEFIASGHDDILRLVSDLGLELLSRDAHADGARIAYFFGGQHYTEAQVAEEFKPVAQRIAADIEPGKSDISYRRSSAAEQRIDALSLDTYLDQIGCRGWLRSLIDIAFVTEFGLDAAQQSALNLLRLVASESARGHAETFRAGDEQFVVNGGNAQIARKLAERVSGQIQFEKRLRMIRPHAEGYALTFDDSNGFAVDVVANIVILAIPFSVLREVKLDVPLPEIKRKAIEELGYGTGAKLIAGFKRPVWRGAGYAGAMFTDAALQRCWEHTPSKTSTEAAMTFLLGGRPGQELGHDQPERQMRRLLVGLERAYPGARDAYMERVVRAHWPTSAYAKGSRACYKPGQWTSIAGAEIEPVGNLYFAGEHCSTEFQGTMNGAVQTGRRVAEMVLASVRNDA